jgi:hypothetical protein
VDGHGFDFQVAIGIFHWRNSSGRTMAMGLTQPLRDMSTGNISRGGGGKGGRCIGLTTLPHSCTDCLEIWEPRGTLRACNRLAQGLLYLYSSVIPGILIGLVPNQAMYVVTCREQKCGNIRSYR